MSLKYSLLNVPPEELEEVNGERVVWGSVPACCHHIPNNHQMNEWNDILH